ncbi:hypothetical protein CNMCM8927_001256 [Aspergillus lentulus]|uniref:Protein kinase domain-containing protein n=1 Tax=Aspergillus lentulus TaxID=293939 RepID=A0AAN5YIA2_ASPLE|nr:hypothetical protein CNMCM6069_000395 [Aspergillus lentulus]KAF4201712.1 hypothetical protein CNMCM8927_001256 [Aspergillus lentulus]
MKKKGGLRYAGGVGPSLSSDRNMMRAHESKNSRLPVRFTHEYTCHSTSGAVFGIKAEEKWKKKRFLGKGSYGEVWSQHCTTDRLGGRLRAYAPCFVRSSGCYEDKLCTFTAIEYMALGDLQGYLGRRFLKRKPGRSQSNC